MIIRPAKKNDFKSILALAQRYDLDSSDMEAMEFIVAEENNRIIGIGRIKRHPDCLELASLGVLESFSGQGVGKKIVLELLKKSKGPVYLATIRPDYFAKLGFKTTSHFPASLIKKSEWCEGCIKEKCNVMVNSNG